MKVIEIINELNNLFFFDKNICIVYAKKIYINKQIIEIDLGDNVYLSNNKLFLFKRKKRELYVYDEEIFKLISTDYTSAFLGEGEFYVFKKINGDDFPVISYFKIDQNEFHIEGFLSIIYVNTEFILNYDTLINKRINSNYINGALKWYFDINENFKIYLKPEVIGHIIYFTAYNEHQKNQLVTGLDVETGKVVWQHQYEVTSANKFISAPAFNEKDQLFYGIGHIYQVFNPKTGEIVLEKIFDECKNYNLLVDAQAVYDNKLWFVAGGGKNTKFGYVNIVTHELELLQDLPHEEYEVFDTPVFHEGKLYLRGKHQNNLYVFE